MAGAPFDDSHRDRCGCSEVTPIRNSLTPITVLRRRIAAVVVHQVITPCHPSKYAVSVRDEALWLIVLVQIPEEVIERAVLQHENDEVVETILMGIRHIY